MKLDFGSVFFQPGHRLARSIDRPQRRKSSEYHANIHRLILDPSEAVRPQADVVGGSQGETHEPLPRQTDSSVGRLTIVCSTN